MAGLTYTKLSFDDLNGWAADDHQAALDVFLNTSPEWAETAGHAASPRAFFEEHFQPVLITDGAPMIFTGYFEPELTGSREHTAQFNIPVYAMPADPTQYTRRQIDEDAPFADQGLELAFLSDPVDLFFLQVQGSGRICLSDGTMLRLGFAGKNGRAYTSVGKILAAHGMADVNPDTIRHWVHENGVAGQALLWENESYVFFREVTETPADQGPIGTMGKPITAGRSIAVDPDCTPLGAPVWVERPNMRCLMVAQDTGSAIKGAQRADIFFGTGAGAGELAGQVNDSGRMITLLPRKDTGGMP